MTTPLGDFGAPPDAVAWAALALAAVLAVISVAPTGPLSSRLSLLSRAPVHGERTFRVAIAALAVLAALLSAGYVAHYLRGGPRIVDATSYFLQARGLSRGHVALPIPSPSGAFRGRFLLASGDGRAISVIFPPGYPAVLALGFLAHAPLLVGPAIGAALVAVTAALALRLFADRRVALLAAALSAVCAVLRYHTADTMSHGWSALLLAVTLHAAHGSRPSSACAAGLAAGALVATRPVSGVVALLLALGASRQSPRRIAWTLLAAAPPVALFLAQQRVATGAWLGSSQLAYYALADGPPGCFRYGFGPGIGCHLEHGDFVRAHLAQGYGALAAAGTTLRRLKMHLADAGNVELFAPLLVCALGSALRAPPARLAALGILAIVLGYAPFYFDGNYPGGGARLLSDALPLEHVLIAGSLVRLGLARLALPLALTGFALHTSYDHRRLAEREGGRPMFEPRVLEDAGVHRGLVFVDTDHGFSLGYDPAVRDAARGIVVARRHHDAHDARLWERLGRPTAYAYEFAPGDAPAVPRVTALSPAELSASAARWEAEAEWPPLALRGGSVVPVFPSCASGHRALAIEPSPAGHAAVRLEVAAPRPGHYRLGSAWVAGKHGVEATLTLGRVTETIREAAPPGACVVVPGAPVEMGEGTEFMDIYADSGQVLDYVELRPEP